MLINKKAAFISAFLFATLSSPLSAYSSPRKTHSEEANRKIVVEFYNKVFNEHDVTGGSQVLSENYIQHNPNVPDGKKPFVDFFTGFFKENPEAKAKIVRIAADKDLVWLHVHSTNGSKTPGHAIVDIFRVKNGKIVEHWDVIQSVPDKAANTNTMF